MKKPAAQERPATAEPGYYPDGAGMYSHTATHRAQSQVKFTDHKPNVRADWSRLDVMCEHEQKQIERLERQLTRAAHPTVAAKVRDKIAKTRTMLERLRKEQRELVS